MYTIFQIKMVDWICVDLWVTLADCQIQLKREQKYFKAINTQGLREWEKGQKGKQTR